MTINIKWNVKPFETKLEKHLNKNLDRAAEYLQADIQKAFPGRGKQPSKPGEIPTVQSGTLKRSIRWERVPGQLLRKVGSIVKGYPYYLEMGIAKRPWLRPALDRNRRALEKLIDAPMP